MNNFDNAEAIVIVSWIKFTRYRSEITKSKCQCSKEVKWKSIELTSILYCREEDNEGEVYTVETKSIECKSI